MSSEPIDRPHVSVVMATLGGPEVQRTITDLNRGTVRPAEVLVCIPEERVAQFDAPLSLADNVRVIATPCRGQVAQRAYGFARAQYEYVLQLDDDIQLERTCLENLLEVLQGLEGAAAVAPSLFVRGAGYAYEPPGPDSALQRLYFRIVNGQRGFQSGEISLAGTNFGTLRPSGVSVEAEWLPGGCVLHRRENLVLEDYYPYKGKAYGEDLFHSLRLRERGVRLFVSRDAHCIFEWGSVDRASFFRHQFRTLRSAFGFARVAKKSQVRLALSLLLTDSVRILEWIRTRLGRASKGN